MRIYTSVPRPSCTVSWYCKGYSYLDLGEDEVEVRGGQLFADQLAILYQSNRTIVAEERAEEQRCRGTRRCHFYQKSKELV